MKNTREDIVNKPSHYRWIKGHECKDIIKNFPFQRACILKYIWRAGKKKYNDMDIKESELKDLQKAKFYIDEEIKDFIARISKNA